MTEQGPATQQIYHAQTHHTGLWLAVHITINVSPVYTSTLGSSEPVKTQGGYTIHIYDNTSKRYRRITETNYIDPDYKLVFGLVAVSEAIDDCVLSFGYDGKVPLEIVVNDPDLVDLIYSEEYRRLPRKAMAALDLILEAFEDYPKLRITVAQ